MIGSVAVVLLLGVVPSSYQHGYLQFPAQRGSLWREGFATPVNYNDNALYCGGRQAFADADGKCGVCGDPYYGEREHEAGGKYALGIIAASYPAGTNIIKATVHLTTHHKGFFEFRLCPHNDPDTPVSQECLDKHLLRIKGASPESQYTRYYPDNGDGVYRVLLEVPQGMTCRQCVLNWRYKTGNSWGVEDDGRSCLGCGFQEEFRNCADISIGYDDITPGTVLNAGSNVTKVRRVKPVHKDDSVKVNFENDDKNDDMMKESIPLIPISKKVSSDERRTLREDDEPENKKEKHVEQVKGQRRRKFLLLRNRDKPMRLPRKFKLVAMSSNNPLLSQIREMQSRNQKQRSFGRRKIQSAVLKAAAMKKVQDARKSLTKRKKSKKFNTIIPRVKTRVISSPKSPKAEIRRRPLSSSIRGAVSRPKLKIRNVHGRNMLPVRKENDDMVNLVPSRVYTTSNDDNRDIFLPSYSVFRPRFSSSAFRNNNRMYVSQRDMLPPYLSEIDRHVYTQSRPLYYNMDSDFLRRDGRYLFK